MVACSTGSTRHWSACPPGTRRPSPPSCVGGDLVGQDVEVAVKVTQVQEQELPELDDEFAQLASEFDTADELTADVRERLGRGKRLEQAAAARDAVLEALLERVDVPLPEAVVTDELNSRRSNIEQQLAYAGITWRSTSRTRARPRRSSRPTSSGGCVTRSSLSCSSTRWQPRRSSASTQDELRQHLVMRAQQSGEDPQEFIKHMVEHNHIPELVQEIRRGKALAQIVESATVTDASGNVVELKNLRPDGTIGEPVEAEADRRDGCRRSLPTRGRRRRCEALRSSQIRLSLLPPERV